MNTLFLKEHKPGDSIREPVFSAIWRSLFPTFEDFEFGSRFHSPSQKKKGQELSITRRCHFSTGWYNIWQINYIRVRGGPLWVCLKMYPRSTIGPSQWFRVNLNLYDAGVFRSSKKERPLRA